MLINKLFCRAFLLIVAILPTVGTSAQRRPPELAPYYAEGQWGFADQTGAMTIPARYDSVGFFTLSLHRGEGKYAIVGNAGKYGVIDQRGNVVLPIKQDYILPYAYLRNKGQYGEYRNGSETYYFSVRRKRLKKLPGGPIFVCGFGFDSECTGFGYCGPNRRSGVLAWQSRRVGVRYGPGNAELPVGLDSVYVGGHFNPDIIFRQGRLAVVEDAFELPDGIDQTAFPYEEVQFFPCQSMPESIYPVIKVRQGRQWALLDLNMPLEGPSTPFRYLDIQRYPNNLYRVEYAPGRYGWLFYNFMDFVEYW